MTGKKEIYNAGKFALLLIVVFSVLFAVSGIAPKNFFEKTTASASNFFFSLVGVQGKIIESETVSIQITNGPRIGFDALCTGLLETILLTAAIAATFEVHWKKRIIGIVFGAIFVFLFNQFRILATTLAILNMEIGFAELAHDVLFKVFLFIAIAALYGAWYWLAIKATSKSAKQKIKQQAEKPMQ